MENNENMLPVEKERQIQLVVNNNQEEDTIDVSVYQSAADGLLRGDATV